MWRMGHNVCPSFTAFPFHMKWEELPHMTGRMWNPNHCLGTGSFCGRWDEQSPSCLFSYALECIPRYKPPIQETALHGHQTRDMMVGCNHSGVVEKSRVPQPVVARRWYFTYNETIIEHGYQSHHLWYLYRNLSIQHVPNFKVTGQDSQGISILETLQHKHLR